MKAEIDDTTAFGCSHHNHSKHRVSVCGLTFDEASVLEGKINDLLDGKFKRVVPLDNKTKEKKYTFTVKFDPKNVVERIEFTTFNKDGLCERNFIAIKWDEAVPKMEPKKEYPLFGKYLGEYEGAELLKMAIYLYKKAQTIEKELTRLKAKRFKKFMDSI